jgi:putative Flp pilus-assembly TadE/G-like protein/von Willebrand factor type A domain-containing protein
MRGEGRFRAVVRRLGDAHAGEEGAVIILSALMMVVLLSAVAFAVDLARLRHEKHVLQAAVDLGALAGAGTLPARGAAQANLSVNAARQIALANAPSLGSGGLTVDFRCVVTDPEGNGGGDSLDVKFACGPASGGNWATGWTTRHGKASHPCNPYVGDLCNTIYLQASKVIDYFFAPVLGIKQGSTGAVMGAACKGFCGQPSSPLDVVMVIDRSRSMTDADMANARNAALSVLDMYEPSIQEVGLVGLPYHLTTNKCLVNTNQRYPTTGNAWRLEDFSSDYKVANGTLNPSSNLVRTIQCLQRAPSNVVTNPSGAGHTDLGDPLETAATMLLNDSRPDVPDVIVFLSDGEANQPRYNQPCSYAATRATAAKAAGIDIFTIAYGVAAARCTYDTTGTYRNAYASTFFAAVATDSIDNTPGSCLATENTDGDHYFCETGSSDLEPVFRRIAVAALERTRLVDV